MDCVSAQLRIPICGSKKGDSGTAIHDGRLNGKCAITIGQFNVIERGYVQG